VRDELANSNAPRVMICSRAMTSAMTIEGRAGLLLRNHGADESHLSFRSLAEPVAPNAPCSGVNGIESSHRHLWAIAKQPIRCDPACRPLFCGTSRITSFRTLPELFSQTMAVQRGFEILPTQRTSEVVLLTSNICVPSSRCAVFSTDRGNALVAILAKRASKDTNPVFRARLD
jgi:hypothetical protein